MADNRQFAKALSDFADGLTEYNHLPPIGTIGFGLGSGPVQASPPALDPVLVNVRRIAEWAAAFQASVSIDLSAIDRGYVRISTMVEIAGQRVHVSECAPDQDYRAVEALFGLGRLESGDSIEVSGERLLSAVTEGAA